MKKSKVFSPEEVSVFCGQIAVMLNGGIPVYEGVRILYDEMEEGATKTVLSTMNQAVEEGKPLHEAMSVTKAFPEYAVEMVKIGEMTGKLEETVRSLSAYYERECAVKDSIKSVISYPTVLLGMMAAILMIMVVKILPMFGDIFMELDGGTGETMSLMHGSIVTARVVSGIVFLLLIALLALLIWYSAKGAESSMMMLLSRNIFSKNLAYKISIGKFFAALSVMNDAGMAVTEAIRNANNVIENKRTKAGIKTCVELLEEGEMIESALLKSKLLDRVKAKMLGVARRSGTEDEMLRRFSDKFDEEIGLRLNSLAAIIETGLVVTLSLVIGIILLSVMIPLMSVLSSIG